MIENDFDAVCPPASATCMDAVDEPADVGVPLMTPPGDSVRPEGTEPVKIDHV